MLRLAWYTADSIRIVDSKTNRTADSIRDSIRTKKNDSQVPSLDVAEVLLGMEGGNGDRRPVYTYFGKKRILKVYPFYLLVS